MKIEALALLRIAKFIPCYPVNFPLIRMITPLEVCKDSRKVIKNCKWKIEVAHSITWDFLGDDFNKSFPLFPTNRQFFKRGLCTYPPENPPLVDPEAIEVHHP